ncbi:MAG: hypothetical protein MZW92_69450 [Comamonadaceae bacterium]|nr:hypothetical protein [Comamonadaceae bacterium]
MSSRSSARTCAPPASRSSSAAAAPTRAAPTTASATSSSTWCSRARATRDARRINLDAERLGAEVNAHTDKDHTAYHMRGLRRRRAAASCAMLADLVRQPHLPGRRARARAPGAAARVRRGRGRPAVDRLQAVRHAPAAAPTRPAQPVIGTRRNIERFSARRRWSATCARQLHRRQRASSARPATIDAARLPARGRAPRSATMAARQREPGVAAPAYAGGVRGEAAAGQQPGARWCSAFRCPRCARDDPAGRAGRGGVRRGHELAAAGPHCASSAAWPTTPPARPTCSSIVGQFVDRGLDRARAARRTAAPRRCSC